jgi:hypothetical protein
MNSGGHGCYYFRSSKSPGFQLPSNTLPLLGKPPSETIVPSFRCHAAVLGALGVLGAALVRSSFSVCADDRQRTPSDAAG